MPVYKGFSGVFDLCTLKFICIKIALYIPARKKVFAAFTIASVFCFVMSVWIILNDILIRSFPII
jgi:hypothetical protein